MKQKTITYQRVKNLGNYEFERLEMTIQIDEGEDEQKAIQALKQKVLVGLNIDEEELIPPF